MESLPHEVYSVWADSFVKHMDLHTDVYVRATLDAVADVRSKRLLDKYKSIEGKADGRKRDRKGYLPFKKNL